MVWEIGRANCYNFFQVRSVSIVFRSNLNKYRFVFLSALFIFFLWFHFWTKITCVKVIRNYVIISKNRIRSTNHANTKIDVSHSVRSNDSIRFNLQERYASEITLEHFGSIPPSAKYIKLWNLPNWQKFYITDGYTYKAYAGKTLNIEDIRSGSIKLSIIPEDLDSKLTVKFCDSNYRPIGDKTIKLDSFDTIREGNIYEQNGEDAAKFGWIESVEYDGKVYRPYGSDIKVGDDLKIGIRDGKITYISSEDNSNKSFSIVVSDRYGHKKVLQGKLDPYSEQDYDEKLVTFKEAGEIHDMGFGRNVKEIDLDNGKANKLNITLKDVLKISGHDHNIKISGDAFDKVTFKNDVGKDGKGTWSKISGNDGYDIYINDADPTLKVKVEQIISDGITN